MTPTNRTVFIKTKHFEILKQKARKLKKETNIPHHEALEHVAKGIGLNNWNHACQSNLPYKLTEEAFKCGCIMVYDKKERDNLIGLNDDFLVEDTFIISGVVRKDLYHHFINSIDEEDEQGRTIGESLEQDEIDDLFEDHVDNLLFIRMKKNGVSLEKVLATAEKYCFFMPLCFWLDGKYFNTVDIPTTDDDKAINNKYFTDNTNGEYATIEVRVPNRFLPRNLQEFEYVDSVTGGYGNDEDRERIVTLSVSTSGRLSKKHLCLNSTELAEDLCHYLIPIFNKRKYGKFYEIEVKTNQSKAKAKISRWRKKHSEEVERLLAL